ncbi:uncharacterized protein LOC119729643 isoform X1 [Patiria miniata]|uniref:Ig-like domain-containing protein n=1 Tax=Patiria miniata TaxID=46514 RepID=A0A914A316_PATMI|nr:uncharacterized protein LOC119729643 isoform X1 [Patiria miniata]
MKRSSIHVFLLVIAGMAFFLPSQTRAYCHGPTDQLVVEGDNATFSCDCFFHYMLLQSATQWVYQIFPEQPVVISSDDDDVVNEQFADKFSVESSGSTKYLHIINVSTVDSGQYFCRISPQYPDAYYNSYKARLSVSREAGNHTSLRLRSPLRCDDISPGKDKHRAGDQVILTCTPPVDSEGMVRAISWSLPGDSVFGGTLYLSPHQHHSYTVTRILQNEDNCKRFRCEASPLDMFENSDDARCAVVPLKIPVSISPEFSYTPVGGQAEFSCSTKGETTSSRFVWRKLHRDTKERSEINGTEGRFQVDASGKTLTISPVLAEDDGTKIVCQVWYEMDCRKPSSWSTLKVLGLETTPSQRGTEATPSDDWQPLQSPGVGMQDVVGAAIGCFLAGVVITSLVALAVWRKYQKKRASPTPRNAATPDPKKVVRYTYTRGVEMDSPANDDSMVYENMDTGPVQVEDDVYEIPNAKR